MRSCSAASGMHRSRITWPDRFRGGRIILKWRGEKDKRELLPVLFVCRKPGSDTHKRGYRGSCKRAARSQIDQTHPKKRRGVLCPRLLCAGCLGTGQSTWPHNPEGGKGGNTRSTIWMVQQGRQLVSGNCTRRLGQTGAWLQVCAQPQLPCMVA